MSMNLKNIRKLALCGGLAIGLTAALAGCDSDVPEFDEANYDEQAEASGEQMLAGRWEQTVALEEFDMPGAPPQAREMLEKAFASKGAQASCVSQEQLDQSIEQRAQDAMQGQNCAMEGFDNELGKISGTMNCSTGAGASSEVKIVGNYDAENLDMSLDMNMKDPSIQGGEGRMKLRLTSRRLGDCNE